MKRLEGLSALISGGASGVGRATAHRFAQEGAARITLFDLDAEQGRCFDLLDNETQRRASVRALLPAFPIMPGMAGHIHLWRGRE